MNMALTKVSLATAAAITVAAVFVSVVGATSATTQFDGWNGGGDYKTTGSAYLDNILNLKFNKSYMSMVDSGGANVQGNVKVGNVTTGNASSSNATAVTVAVNNTSSSNAALQAGMSSGSSSKSSSSVYSSTASNSAPMHFMMPPMDSSSTKYSTKEYTESSEWQAQKTDVDNETTATFEDKTCITATTGDVNAQGNTEVGNITTGNATSTNTSSVIFTVAN